MGDAGRESSAHDTEVLPPEDAEASEKSGAQQVADALGASTRTHDRALSRVIWVVAALIVLGAVLMISGVLLSRRQAASLPSDSRGASAETPPNSMGASTPAETRGAEGRVATAGTIATSAIAGGDASGTSVPSAPPATAAALPELGSSPPRTIAMVVVPRGFAGASYRVVFRPFGWAAGGSANGRLIMVVDSDQPTDSGAKALGQEFAKRNLMVWCTPECAAQIGRAGTYNGVLEVRPQGDVGLLYLTKASAR